MDKRSLSRIMNFADTALLRDLAERAAGGREALILKPAEKTLALVQIREPEQGGRRGNLRFGADHGPDRGAGVCPASLALIGLIIIAAAHSLTTFLIAAALMGIATGGEQPILMAECIKSADASKRGRASNTSYVGMDIGNFAGSNLAGILVAAIGYRHMFLAAIVPVVLGTLFFGLLYKKRQVT
jgi:MFS family permease